MMLDSRICRVIVWENGMVMTFDKDGKQLPQYQGHRDEILLKVIAAMPPNAHLKANCIWAYSTEDESDAP